MALFLAALGFWLDALILHPLESEANKGGRTTCLVVGVFEKESTEIQCVALCGGDKNHRPRYVRATLPFLPHAVRKGRKALTRAKLQTSNPKQGEKLPIPKPAQTGAKAP